MPSQRTKASVIVRNATLDDVPRIAALVLKVYGRPADGYTPGMLRAAMAAHRLRPSGLCRTTYP